MRFVSPLGSSRVAARESFIGRSTASISSLLSNKHLFRSLDCAAKCLVFLEGCCGGRATLERDACNGDPCEPSVKGSRPCK